MPSRGSKTSSSTPSKTPDSIHEKLDLILARLDNFDSRLKKLEYEQMETTKGLNFMSDEMQKFKVNLIKGVNAKNIVDLEEQLDQLTHHRNRKNLVIDGIPYKAGEDLFQAIKVFSDKVSYEINPNTDINNLYRLKKSDKIVMQFLQIHKRDKFLSSCKRAKVVASDLSFKSNNSRIFVNEMLTPKQTDLFHQVRTYKKENGYNFALTNNNRIFLRKTPDSEVIPTRTINDLTMLV